jgi:hypothetical protein
MAFSSQPNEDGGSDAELRGSSLELEAWLNDGQPLRGADNGHLNNGVGQGSRHAGGDDEGRDGEGGDEDGEDEDNGPPPPLWLPPGVIAANPYCPRGGKAARLLRAAANLTKEQARRYSQWSLEGRYHEQEGEEAHDQHPEEQAASVGEGRLPARSFRHLYPTASAFPTAEEPPADFDIREFLSAVCVQAKNCLPGFTKSCKKGTTTPEELIQWIVHSYSFVQPSSCSPPLWHTANNTSLPQITNSGSPLSVPSLGNTTLDNILCVVKVCGELEVADAVVQLKYWLNSIKLACLVNR